MNKLWISVIVGVLLVVILTVTLSVVLTRKKKKTDSDVQEVIWAFHLEHDSGLKLRAQLEDIMNVDILKKSDYSAGGNNANVREVSQEFPNGKLAGWTHYFEHPLRVKKVVVGSNEIVVQKLAALAGFAFFNREGSSDFVTLWHDEKFHHYSTTGELLAVGAFPFADGDLSIHPDKMKLPKEFTGNDFEQTTSAEESDLEFPKDQIIPPSEPTSKAAALTIDLTKLKTVDVDQPYKYTEGNDELTVLKTVFGESFRKVTYSLTAKRAFAPQVKNVKTVDLECNDVSDLVVYLNSESEPLLVTAREPKSVKTFVLTVDDKWTLVNIPSVTVEVLDDVHCSMNDLALFDFSHQSGSYKAGKYTIEVTPTNASDEPYATFKSFKHNIYKLDEDGQKTNVTAKIHKFKYLRTSFTGLAHDRLVNFATAYFWEGDLTKPLVIRLNTPSGTTPLDYYGYKEYVTERMPTMLEERLHSANFDFNRVFVANLNRQDSYDFKGGVSSTAQKDVIVKVTNNAPLEGFKKCVHTHKDGENKPFHILRFLNETNLTVSLPDVLSLETYFFTKKSNTKPVFFALKSSTQLHCYVLEGNSYVKKDLVNRNLVLTLKKLVYDADKYLTVDLVKFTTYNFTGEAVSAKLPEPNVLVKRFNLTGFVRTAHTIGSEESPEKFRLLAIKGARLDFDDNEYSGVEAYFCNGHLEDPLAVILKGTTDVVYVAAKYGFEKKDDKYLTDDLLPKLMKLAQRKLDLVYLKLEKEENYYDVTEDRVKVEVKSESFDTDGKKKNTHTFPETEDVRLTYGDKYFKPQVEFTAKLVKVVAIMDSNKAPLLVTFVDSTDKQYHFRKDQNAWKRVKSADLSAQEGNDASSESKQAASTANDTSGQSQQANEQSKQE